MSPADVALAQRAVACPRWRWLPGMLARDPAPRAEYRTCRVLGMGDPLHVEGIMRPAIKGFTLDYAMRPGAPPLLPGREHWVPDLSDPATLGCLLALVREGHGSPQAYCAPQADTHYEGEEWWVVCHGNDSQISGAPTESAALVAALEGAP